MTITDTSVTTNAEGQTFEFEEAGADFLGEAGVLPEEQGAEAPEPDSNSGLTADFRPDDDPTDFLNEEVVEEEEEVAPESDTDVEGEDATELTNRIRQQMKEQGIQEPEPEAPPSPEDEFEQRIESVQNFDEFNNTFKTVMGVEAKEAFKQYNDMVTTTQALVAEVKQTYQEMALLKQEVRLRQEWGANYDANLASVKEAYKRLPATMQQALSDDNGALLIWRSLNGSGELSARKAPNTINGRRATSTGQPKLKYSEILAMNDKEYNSPRVQQALATGNFIKDVNV